MAVSHRMVPRIDQVAQIACRRLDRRNARHIGRRAPGQQGRGTIDAGVTQPRLGRGDQPAGDAGSLVSGELADDVVSARIPGQGGCPWRQVMGAGQVQERWQQDPAGHLAMGHQLRHGERLHLGTAVARLSL